MNQNEREALESLCRHLRETALLDSVAEALGWDERTMLPPRAGEYRADQIAYLSGLVHARRTEPRVGEWLDRLAGSPAAQDLHSDIGATIREARRQYNKQIKLPRTLVEQLARTSVQAQQVWVQARKDNDFAAFAPWLQKTVELKRQQAEAQGYPDCPYDALLDDYEPGAKTADVTRTLAGLREELRPLVTGLAETRRRPRADVLHRDYPVEAQEVFGREAAARIGFDFQRGRLDVTTHPFCARLGPHDCRITTRYNRHAFAEAFFGTLHEAGHGIYEQGLRVDQFGLPPGSAASLGIHESQSRLWENLVGRGEGFWHYFFPVAQRHFPAALSDVELADFVFCINAVEPSLIRIEADEATYNLHIVIRFELEQELISGALPVADPPQAWNDKYQENLGICPPSDAEGVLQDIHWSAGLFGYFPTYSLGNLYAAQFFDRARQDLGDLQSMFAAGEFAPLRDWLGSHIYERGFCDTPDQLVEQVTQAPLSHRPLMEYLRGKLGPLYGI